MIRWAASDDQPDLRAVVTSLPVAGFTGSLSDRFDQGAPEGPGRVRAKTGTLTGVTSLAGIAVDLDGSLLVFAMIADQVQAQPERAGPGRHGQRRLRARRLPLRPLRLQVHHGMQPSRRSPRPIRRGKRRFVCIP